MRILRQNSFLLIRTWGYTGVDPKQRWGHWEAKAVWVTVKLGHKLVSRNLKSKLESNVVFAKLFGSQKGWGDLIWFTVES